MSEPRLHLAPDLSMPLDAITETFGILAARGAGKSNTAAVMAEEMHEHGLPFCVVDPVGSWWGLRSNAAGNGPGLPLAIFGGPKGDVPLERKGGNLIADIVVDERISCVLDLRGFDSEGAKKEFLLDFARRLYTRNEAPLHLFLEEADDYIPQKPLGQVEPLLLRAWENIVRRGRSRGLGMTMITQRSASLNKNVLTQAQTLIAMRTTGPQDRKAIEEWVKYNDQSRDILETLSGLADGEAWVWSPQFLKVTKRVQFRRRRTFDSGSTPKMAAKGKTATLADIDVSTLRVRMADTIKRAEEVDPKKLKARIAELERKLSSTTSQPVANNNLTAEALEQFEQVRIENERLRADNRALEQHRDAIMARFAELAATVEDVEQKLTAAVQDLANDRATLNRAPRTLPPFPTLSKPSAPAPAVRPLAGAHLQRPAAVPAPRTSKGNGSTTNAGLSGPQQRIIDALAWWETIGDTRPERAAVAAMAKYSVTSSSFGVPVSQVKKLGLLVDDDGTLSLTDAGRKVAHWPAQVTGEQLRERVLGRLQGPQRRLLEPLLAAYPNPLSNADLAEQSGYSLTSSSYGVPRSQLKKFGLIEYRGDAVIAREILFP